MRTEKILQYTIAAVFSAALAVGAAFADHEHRDEKGNYIPHLVENQLYKQECSACHFLYLPGLLPSRSWEAVINGSDKHFGEDLALDEKAQAEILGFLKANSAEKTRTEWSYKIMKSLGAATPARITDVPWIIKEHKRVKPDVYSRTAIGTKSNCAACHPKGTQGDFETVKIPK